MICYNRTINKREKKKQKSKKGRYGPPNNISFF